MNENIKTTKSSLFLLPLTMVPLDMFSGFINAYYRCEYDKVENEDGGVGSQYKERIYVVFKEKDVNDEKRLKLTFPATFLQVIDVEDFVIFSYRILPYWLSDFKVFKRGKYSQFSEAYKQLLIGHYSNKVLGSKIKLLLYPSAQVKKAKAKELGIDPSFITELSSKPNPLDETFVISKLYKLKL